MTTWLDLGPAGRHMTDLLCGLDDDQLGATTPCEKTSIGVLVDHVGGLSLAFTQAAAKQLGAGTGQSQSADAPRLGADWCVRTCEQVDALAEAWRSHDAWEGMTQAGGVDMPAEVTGRVALNELVIHGWDIARASGQQYQPDTQSLQESLQFVAAAQQEEPRKEGLFGPPVPIADDAPLLDRLIALSGRDPGWAPPNGQR